MTYKHGVITQSNKWYNKYKILQGIYKNALDIRAYI